MSPQPTHNSSLSPCCIWFTGFSGAGKSTLAEALEAQLRAEGRAVYVLDGDKLRNGLNADLGFREADRIENVRRVAEVARLMVDAGITVIVALISPLRSGRDRARGLFAPGRFFEVFIDTPLAVCEQRDVKGLYARARQGLIPDFTGIDSPYEPPISPEITLHTSTDDLASCLRTIRLAISAP